MWEKIKPIVIGFLSGLAFALGLSWARGKGRASSDSGYRSALCRYDRGANAGSRVAEDALWDRIRDNIRKAGELASGREQLSGEGEEDR